MSSSKAGASFGTNSPPVEATEHSDPMGVSNIEGERAKGLSDEEQRKAYLKKNKPEDLNPHVSADKTLAKEKTKID